MQIHLTHHARQRMRERGINRGEVIWCLENYQISRPGEEGKRIYDYTDEQGYKTSVSATIKSGRWIIASVWRVKT